MTLTTREAALDYILELIVDSEDVGAFEEWIRDYQASVPGAGHLQAERVREAFYQLTREVMTLA